MTNEKLTYKQAYDKIIQAYFRDEIQPADEHFCFCGTLANNKADWRYRNSEYTTDEYLKMETALLLPFGVSRPHGWDGFYKIRDKPKKPNEYEDILFIGMCNALEVLKEIHRSRGEDVDEVPVFVKRELVTT